MEFNAKRAYEILIELYAKQENIKIDYEIVEKKNIEETKDSA